MNTLNLLGISASPRREANSLFLLEKAIEGAKEAATGSLSVSCFSFHGKRIGPCVQCYRCDKTHGDCVIKDDFQPLRDEWLAADIVLYSVPVWHLSIPSQLKSFFDRLGQSLSKRYPRKRFGQVLHLKVVGNIAQGMDIFSGQESALLDLMNHAVLENCLVVSGETYIGVGGWARWSRDPKRIETLVNEGDEVAAFSVEAAKSLGRRTVQLAMILRKGFEAMEELLRQDPSFQPVLERLDSIAMEK
jgi:multimeric flavodoxin WrbA